MSDVLTIIMLTIWWLEYRMSKVLTLWVLDYHMSSLLHISSINRLEAGMSNVLLIAGASHIPCINPMGARLSCVSCINHLMARLSHAFYNNLLMVKVSHVSCISTLGVDSLNTCMLTFWWLEYQLAYVSTFWWLEHHLPHALPLRGYDVSHLNILLARVSLVSCINLFGANQLHVDPFSIQFGANQIINWCAPINYLNYLVRAKSFGAHQLIS